MATDPYQVLGVAKDASPDDIRKAYRKLAKELHPDLNPGNAKAADRFKEVASAYDIVGDPEKRARYDRGEIDATGAERPQQPFYREYADGGGGQRYHTTAGFDDFENVSDIFADLFARGRPGPRGSIRMKGQDVFYRLDVGFLDAARGGKKRITLPNGTALDLTIPEGVANGQILRLKEKGEPGIGGGAPGDALVEIAVASHPLFERRGDDILIDLPIAIHEAVLGGKVEAPTVSGSVSLTVPPGASSGQVLRLRGKGLKRADGRGHGDQLVRLKIVLPLDIDAELKDFMKGWGEKHAYDPRAKMKATP